MSLARRSSQSELNTAQCYVACLRRVVELLPHLTKRKRNHAVYGWAAAMKFYMDHLMTLKPDETRLDSVRVAVEAVLGYRALIDERRDPPRFPVSKNIPPGQPFDNVLVEAIADTQALATSLANTARIACIHAPYEGQKATSGNFGFGIGGKMELESGPCASFSLYHLKLLCLRRALWTFQSPACQPPAAHAGFWIICQWPFQKSEKRMALASRRMSGVSRLAAWM